MWSPGVMRCQPSTCTARWRACRWRSRPRLRRFRPRPPTWRVTRSASRPGARCWDPLADRVDWRWRLGRSGSPWYPGARLYRQRFGEDWSGVLARVRADLDALAGAGETGGKNAEVDAHAERLFAQGLDFHRQGLLEPA